MIDQQKMLGIIHFMNSPVDKRTGNPKYDVKEEHGTSNNPKQPIKLFIVSIRNNVAIL